MLVRIFGSDDGGATWKPLALDADGHLQADVLSLPALAAGTNNIGDVDVLSVAGDNLIFKYKARIIGTESDTTAAAGTNTLFSGAVPAGEIWIINQAGAQDNNNATTNIEIGIYYSGLGYPANHKNSPGAKEWVFNVCPMVLMPGDKTYATLRGVTLNDDIYLRWAGYSVKIS